MEYSDANNFICRYLFHEHFSRDPPMRGKREMDRSFEKKVVHWNFNVDSIQVYRVLKDLSMLSTTF